MKKISSLFSRATAAIGAFLGMSSVALAQTNELAGNATCRVNGQVVSCDQAWSAVGGILSIFAKFFLFLALIGIVTSIFWLWMLIDCLKRTFTKDSDKILWALVIFFLHFVGALIYYFVVKAADKKSAA